tara:strand:+ start:1594 stop:1875 length:282 start_codon:yes stop_codon:yes gene_type:complete
MSDDNTVQFSKDELETLKEIQTEYGDISAELGQIQITKLRLTQQHKVLMDREEALSKSFSDNQAKEKTFVSTITEKYGDGQLDPKTGAYIKKS